MAFNPNRLTLLRELSGLTKEELAEHCHVSRRAVTDWESGKVANPPLELIADMFDVVPGFFEMSELQSIDAADVSFRALSSLGTRRTKKVLAAARLSIEFSSWLDSRFLTPSVDVPSLDQLASPTNQSDCSPSETARLLRAAWRLGDKPIRDMLVLLERRGIRVFSVPAADRDVDAFSFWQSNRPFIFLNTDKSAERVRFDLAHELGHIVLHKGLGTARERRFEFEANEFASAFLMPTDGILAQAATASRGLRISDMLIMKRSWRVSALAMVRRVYDLNLISDWQYRKWMIDLSSRGYRGSEPDGIHPEQSRLLGAVLARAREFGLNISDIALECGIPRQSAEDALSGLTFVPVAGGKERRSVRGSAAVTIPRMPLISADPALEG